MKRILLVLLMLALSMPALADQQKPGEGVKARPGRATWNTGYFQEALVSAGLKELGYNVMKPKELQNPLFYQSLALGDLDYWTNGWFPVHDGQVPKNFWDKGEKVGYVVKAGGLQGYLVSKKEVEKFNIKSIADFKRPEVKEAFDANGDGKADLTACPAGWGCEGTIAHHMDVYDLEDDINLIKAAYSASMADALARYKSGQPAFFYTWAPNWTIFKFKPGEDVVWMNVPEIKPTERNSSLRILLRKNFSNSLPYLSVILTSRTPRCRKVKNHRRISRNTSRNGLPSTKRNGMVGWKRLAKQLSNPGSTSITGRRIDSSGLFYGTSEFTIDERKY